jgi:hypothetical protein
MRAIALPLSKLPRELRWAWWDVRVRSAIMGDRFDAWIQRTCPDLPNYRGRDVTLAFAPSLLMGYALRIVMPVIVAASTLSIHRVAIAAVAGRIACAAGERLGLRRVDARYRGWWLRRAHSPRPSVVRVVAVGKRLGDRTRPWTVTAFAAGAALAMLAIGLRAAMGDLALSAPIGICALALLFAAIVLAMLMLLGTMAETLVPVVLGPPSRSAHVVSHEELRGLRPLLATWPAKVLHDVWELLRAVRP